MSFKFENFARVGTPYTGYATYTDTQHTKADKNEITRL